MPTTSTSTDDEVTDELPWRLIVERLDEQPVKKASPTVAAER